ncbi:MAG: DUF3021 family protein [Oribacterium sinus]|uniref:DUF3021 family protein n=1 Tax=Oribacterium sinus TaxID=237576 RepID=A0A930H1J5_9FIRM|nr:DUF3021 family protein [Oribacterium sinus]
MQKLKIIFHQTFMISTAILFGIGMLMLIQHFLSGVQTFSFQWSDPLSICFTGFLSSLPSYFLLDLDSLKKSEVWSRMGIHFVAVLGIVGLGASLFHWFGQIINLRIICFMYSFIYLFIWCATAWMAKADEIKINEAIKDLQDSE